MASKLFGQDGAGMGPLRCTFPPTSRGLAQYSFRPEDGRALSIDLSFAGGAFTSVSSAACTHRHCCVAVGLDYGYFGVPTKIPRLEYALESKFWHAIQIQHPVPQSAGSLADTCPFSSFSTRFIDAPARVTAYIDAFRQLHPHRLVAVQDLPDQEVMSQPLFHSWRIQHMGSSISWEAWARQGSVRLQQLVDM